MHVGDLICCFYPLFVLVAPKQRHSNSYQRGAERGDSVTLALSSNLSVHDVLCISPSIIKSARLGNHWTGYVVLSY